MICFWGVRLKKFRKKLPLQLSISWKTKRSLKHESVGTFHFTLNAFHPVRISQAIYFLLLFLLKYAAKLFGFVNVPIYFTIHYLLSVLCVNGKCHIESFKAGLIKILKMMDNDSVKQDWTWNITYKIYFTKNFFFLPGSCLKYTSESSGMVINDRWFLDVILAYWLGWQSKSKRRVLPLKSMLSDTHVQAEMQWIVNIGQRGRVTAHFIGNPPMMRAARV